MPETRFRVRWPDGSEEWCYSPSTVIKNYFEVNKSYDLDKFRSVSRAALQAASDRVAAVHGFACSSAAGQLRHIEHKLNQFAGAQGACVDFLGYEGN